MFLQHLDGQLHALVADRGRREGVFQTDVLADWLVTSCIALTHAAVDEARSGRMSAASARTALAASARDLFVGAVIRETDEPARRPAP